MRTEFTFTKVRASLPAFFSALFAALLICLFLYVASSKWEHMATFTHSMLNQPFPRWMALSLTWFLPPVEFIIAVLLMFRKTQLIGFKASFVLMTLFTLYIAAILLHFFPRVPCSCGGVIQQFGWTEHFYFNMLCILVSLGGILLQRDESR